MNTQLAAASILSLNLHMAAILTLCRLSLANGYHLPLFIALSGKRLSDLDKVYEHIQVTFPEVFCT